MLCCNVYFSNLIAAAVLILIIYLINCTALVTTVVLMTMWQNQFILFVFSLYSIEAKVCFSYTFSTGNGNSQKSISKSHISIYYPKYKRLNVIVMWNVWFTVLFNILTVRIHIWHEVAVRKICCFLSFSIYGGSRSALVSEHSCSFPWQQRGQIHWQNVR